MIETVSKWDPDGADLLEVAANMLPARCQTLAQAIDCLERLVSVDGGAESFAMLGELAGVVYKGDEDGELWFVDLYDCLAGANVRGIRVQWAPDERDHRE